LSARKRLRPSQASEETRWLRNVDLAEYLGVSIMCIWRWQRDPALGFPKPTRINNISYTDREAVDAWMRSRVISLAASPARRRAAS